MNNRPTYLQVDGASIRKVAFFADCLMDTMFMETNNETSVLLQKAGCDVIIPEQQGCCGALHAHSGEKDMAKQLAKANIEAFEALEVDDIVLNAGGCGAILIEYDYLLKDEEDWQKRAKTFSSKVKDFSEILVEQDFDEKPMSLTS